MNRDQKRLDLSRHSDLRSSSNVWPRFLPRFGLGEVMECPERSLVPPLGLITVAALCPRQWKIRLVTLRSKS